MNFFLLKNILFRTSAEERGRRPDLDYLSAFLRAYVLLQSKQSIYPLGRSPALKIRIISKIIKHDNHVSEFVGTEVFRKNRINDDNNIQVSDQPCQRHWSRDIVKS